jgi:lipoprotein-anchoring transpeptidase ErfK/SrfK
MPSNLEIASSAVQNAFKELRLGKKQAARSWAQRAIALAPELEEPWLILAAVSRPRASLQYLKQALKINPGSQRARQGLLSVQKKLERTSRASLTQPVQPAAAAPEARLQPQAVRQIHLARPNASAPAARPAPVKKDHRPLLKWAGWLVLTLAGLVLVLAGFLGLSHNGSVNARGLTPAQPKSVVLQSMATATPTVTATPLPTDIPSLTPIPTDTPLPSPTELPPPTATALPAPTQTAPPPPMQPADAPTTKRIMVSISQQHLYAYQGDTLVYSFVVSTGAENSTRAGSFTILDKIPNAWSDPWGFWMPYWLGIYWVGYTENGIHALPVLTNGNVIWGSGLGTPISHGCVVLSTQDARVIYEWVDVGTQVDILR